MPGFRCPAPGAWLGAATQRTRQMRLGVLAYTLPIHPPAALAEEVAILDHLSGGRLEVGVGLGHRPRVAGHTPQCHQDSADRRSVPYACGTRIVQSYLDPDGVLQPRSVEFTAQGAPHRPPSDETSSRLW